MSQFSMEIAHSETNKRAAVGVLIFKGGLRLVRSTPTISAVEKSIILPLLVKKSPAALAGGGP